ncbi:Zinc resistance conferring protein [Rhodosporidiobolus nylandii]
MPPSNAGLTSAQKARAREVTLIKRALAVTSVYMLAELVIGYQFSVLSLVADSYHMMNDVAAFVVQLYADELGNLERSHAKETTAFSFGFARVEFLANLIQGVLLIALCLTLALESVQRFYSTEHIALPPIVVGMGLAALVWNLVMFRLFEDAPGSHAHSIGRHPWRYRARLQEAATAAPSRLALSASSRSFTARSLSKSTSTAKPPKAGFRTFFKPQNSLAVHAFGDAAGNVAVVVDGLASWLFGPKNGYISGLVKSWSGTPFIDPLCSLVVVYVILIHAFPLVTKSSFFLMHAFDPLKTSKIRRVFRSQEWLPQPVASHVEVVLEELLIWALSEKSRFATVNLSVRPRMPAEPTALELADIAAAAKRVLQEVAPPSQVSMPYNGNNASDDLLWLLTRNYNACLVKSPGAGRAINSPKTSGLANRRTVDISAKEGGAGSGLTLSYKDGDASPFSVKDAVRTTDIQGTGINAAQQVVGELDKTGRTDLYNEAVHRTYEELKRQKGDRRAPRVRTKRPVKLENLKPSKA